jgi:beta-lactamase superfamily II metal-dependent hydrolase
LPNKEAPSRAGREQHVNRRFHALFILLFILFFLPAAFLQLAFGQPTEQKGPLEIRHIDVGQADSTLIIGTNRNTLLVDAGETRWNTHRNADRINEYMSTVIGKKDFTYFLVTHYHCDHIGYPSDPPKGGVRYLMENYGFSFTTFIDRGFDMIGQAPGTLRKYRTWVDRFTNRYVPKLGDTSIDLGPGVKVTVVAVNGNGLLPEGDLSATKEPPSENDYSIALQVSYGRFQYFIGGDLSGELYKSRFGYIYHDIETDAGRRAGEVEVYKVNHHGSGHSSNETFVKTLNPLASIISCGKNSFGHPDPNVVERLKAVSRVYQTEDGEGNVVNGDITVTADGGDTFTVECSATTDSTEFKCHEALAETGGGKPSSPAADLTALTVVRGRLKGGAVEDLRADDRKFIDFSSIEGDGIDGYDKGSAYADWYVRAKIPAGSLEKATLFFELTGRASRDATLTILAWSPEERQWRNLGDAPLTTKDERIVMSAPSAGLVAPDGTVAVRFRVKAPSAQTPLDCTAAAVRISWENRPDAVPRSQDSPDD